MLMLREANYEEVSSSSDAVECVVDVLTMSSGLLGIPSVFPQNGWEGHAELFNFMKRKSAEEKIREGVAELQKLTPDMATVKRMMNVTVKTNGGQILVNQSLLLAIPAVAGALKSDAPKLHSIQFVARCQALKRAFLDMTLSPRKQVSQVRTAPPLDRKMEAQSSPLATHDRKMEAQSSSDPPLATNHCELPSNVETPSQATDDRELLAPSNVQTPSLAKVQASSLSSSHSFPETYSSHSVPETYSSHSFPETETSRSHSVPETETETSSSSPQTTEDDWNWGLPLLFLEPSLSDPHLDADDSELLDQPNVQTQSLVTEAEVQASSPSDPHLDADDRKAQDSSADTNDCVTPLPVESQSNVQDSSADTNDCVTPLLDQPAMQGQSVKRKDENELRALDHLGDLTHSVSQLGAGRQCLGERKAKLSLASKSKEKNHLYVSVKRTEDFVENEKANTLECLEKVETCLEAPFSVSKDLVAKFKEAVAGLGTEEEEEEEDENLRVRLQAVQEKLETNMMIV